MILKDSNNHILRFDRGDDVMALLMSYATENSITAATFSVIGACSEVVLAFYDLEEKKYHDKTLYEDMEIVSVTGNIGQLDQKPTIHAHGVVSDIDLVTHGGHIKKLIISATGEVVLTVLNGTLTRAFDTETGLNLLT